MTSWDFGILTSHTGNRVLYRRVRHGFRREDIKEDRLMTIRAVPNIVLALIALLGVAAQAQATPSGQPLPDG